MHSAPAVSTVVERPMLVLWITIVLAALSLLICAIAGRQTDYSWPLFATSFLATTISLRACRAFPAGLLSWDGYQWLWSDFRDQRLCTLKICHDFQWGVLLYLRNSSGSSAWLFLNRNACGAQWAPLRRAFLAKPDVVAP